MPTLRITQNGLPTGEHHVQLDLTSDGLAESAFAQFSFAVADQDREDLRWYLEDYLQYPIDPAPQIAARVEQRMHTLGGELYAHLFDSNPAARRLWARMEPHLRHVRVEVASEADADAVLPWELLHDPHSNTDLAVHAHSFVRVQRQTGRPATLPKVAEGERIRVLLVICRPGGRRDVPFRSVASHLVRLSAQAREAFHLDVLRPPTFQRLAEVLRQAAARGEPYHVVHFDGHGTWRELRPDDPTPTTDEAGGRWDPLRYAAEDDRRGYHGYLLFEQPATTDNIEYVDGLRLGNLLAETGVPVLVLNACQSAHADLTTTPQNVAAAPATDVQTRVRAYGSLAQEVVDAGVAGVVAMRYSVYVVTAAQFIADLYAALLDGLPLGQAVTMGRKQLATQPDREIAFTPRPLQDWVVPVVYEATPLGLFPKPRTGEQLHITVDPAQAGRERARLDPSVPTGPDVGFFGRDETLLALDRAFDEHQVVLLHAFAGAGKTSTAVEFARWYQHTGGVQGLVLFSSFEHHLPLARALDQLGAAFEGALEQAGVHWLALEPGQRLQAALDVLRQVPVLWIWDNIEPIAGFPEGAPSAWSADEQEELIRFLQDVRDTKAKVLLTSRREERAWLGELPVRIGLPPMPLAERFQLARAIATRHGRRLVEVEDWRPLLDYTQGNPLTVTVLVGQALREGLHTREQAEGFVARLRAGEALDDDPRQGRDRSLGASLAYGFQTAFTEGERAQLAVLHLFQGVVGVEPLCYMGDPKVVGDAAIRVLAGLSPEMGIELLDRAVEVGLLAPLDRYYYTIHPAVPWYFAELFTQFYGPPDSLPATGARLAYTREFASLCQYFSHKYFEGQTRVAVSTLAALEANLLHALSLARTGGWWAQMIGAMGGLRVLYNHTGRRVEWARLVGQVTPNLVDLTTDQPLPGREDQWITITEFRVELATRARDWLTATRLQQAAVALARQQAKAALAGDSTRLSPKQHYRLARLASALQGLGQLLVEQQQPGCIQAYTEALELHQRIGDQRSEAITAYNLGRAYVMLQEPRDLDQAERWFQHALDHYDPADWLRRAQATGELGRVHLERFNDAQAAARPAPELLGHLNAALKAYVRALNLYPTEAVGELAVTHNQLGSIYALAGLVDSAMGHFRDAVRFFEAAGDGYDAATARYNVAAVLAQQDRLEEAFLWAQAALTGYREVGPGAADSITKTEQLLTQIEQDRTGGTSSSP